MKTLRNILSVMIVIGLVVLELYLIGMISTERFVSKQAITKVTEQLNLVEVMSEAPVTTGDGKQQTVLDEVYEVAEKANLDPSQVDAVLNSTIVKELAATYMHDVANYALKGTDHQMTGEEISAIVRDNIDVISKEAKLDAPTSQRIVTTVMQHQDEFAALLPAPSKVFQVVDTSELEGLQQLFDQHTKIKVVIAIIALTLLLMLVRFSFYRWLPWSSVANVIAGAVACLMSLGITPMIAAVLSEKNQVLLLKILDTYAHVISQTFLICGLVLLVISFVEISIYSSLKYYLRQKEANDARQRLKEEHA